MGNSAKREYMSRVVVVVETIMGTVLPTQPLSGFLRPQFCSPLLLHLPSFISDSQGAAVIYPAFASGFEPGITREIPHFLAERSI
jgi:hypothetical protein